MPHGVRITRLLQTRQSLASNARQTRAPGVQHGAYAAGGPGMPLPPSMRDCAAARLLRHWQASHEVQRGSTWNRQQRHSHIDRDGPVLQGLLDVRPTLGLDVAAFPVEDAVARGLAVAQVYAFASVDYPGAAQSLVFDSDGTTAVGAFDFDPGIDSPRPPLRSRAGFTRFSPSRARPLASLRASMGLV